jgi:hypothetical protein
MDMDRTLLKATLDKLSEDIESITEEKIKSIQRTLLNLLEAMISENDQLRAENQQLRDEINRLKGEQGKPNIRKQTRENQNFSSENERNGNRKKKKKKQRKKNKISIDRVEFCTLDKNQLPPDAVFKGYYPVVVQDIIIKTDNIEFKKAIYYSPSLKKTFVAPLPTGYQGEFGPHIKAEIISLYYKSKMTELSIVDYLKDHGILIGKGTVSRFLTDMHEQFHLEKKEIVQEGLLSSGYQQMDDTSARVKGKNYYAHILCNEFYTAYFTRPHKDRLTILSILTQGDMRFKINQAALARMKAMHLPEKFLNAFRQGYLESDMNRREIDALLNAWFPGSRKYLTHRLIILEAAAITAYQELPHAVKLLMTDDAPQYNQVTAYHALCWVHDGRHYKKLNPIVIRHRILLNNFIEQYWAYYKKLLLYKATPTAAAAEVLSQEFDDLFSTKTDYEQLNERIQKTKEKKDQLLLALQFPEIPLHNNASELGARDQSRRRDISFHTINEKGTEAKDTFMTIAQTARKLTINFFQYICDRISQKNKMASLASLISLHSRKMVPNTS